MSQGVMRDQIQPVDQKGCPLVTAPVQQGTALAVLDQQTLQLLRLIWLELLRINGAKK